MAAAKKKSYGVQALVIIVSIHRMIRNFITASTLEFALKTPTPLGPNFGSQQEAKGGGGAGVLKAFYNFHSLVGVFFEKWRKQLLKIDS